MTRRLRRVVVVASVAASVAAGGAATAVASDTGHVGSPLSVRGTEPAAAPATQNLATVPEASGQSSTTTPPAATAVVPEATTANTAEASTTYVSRPDLPRFNATTTQPGTPHPGVLFGGYLGTTGNGNSSSALVVYGNDGEPVWIKPHASSGATATPVKYGNTDALAYIVAPGRWEIISGGYTKIAEVAVETETTSSGAHFALFPNSNIAAVSGTRSVVVDLTPYGGSGPAVVRFGTVSTVNIQTGEVLSSWSSLTPGAEETGQGAIPVSDTYRQRQGNLLDYLGISSIAFGDAPNRILISARGTSAVYEIDTTTGEIVWALGGKRPTVQLPDGTPAPNDPFSVGAHEDGALYVGDADPQTGRARGLVYRTDGTAPTSLIKQIAPDTAPVVQANSRGAFQPVSGAVPVGGTYAGLLSLDGSVFEYDADGAQVFTATAPTSQRTATVRSAWDGRPTTSPDIAAEVQGGNHAVVYASWNGSDQVAQWRVQIGADGDNLRVVTTAPRAGFETALPIDYIAADQYVRVDALDANGSIIGTVDRPGLLPMAEAYVRAGGAETLGGYWGRSSSPDRASIQYEYGSIEWSPRTGAHPITGAIYRYYSSGGGGGAGLPLTDAVALPDGRGTQQEFERGSIYHTAETGAHTVSDIFRDKYRAMGAERGSLGYPKTDQFTVGNPSTPEQRFEGGVLVSGAPGWNGPVYALTGAIGVKWIAMGGLSSPMGLPKSDVQTTPDKVGRFVHFTNFWSVYWTPSTGAQALDDPMVGKWSANGWELGFLGYPVTSVATTPDGVGRYAHFQGGSIYWTNGTGAAIVRGSIRDKWAANGWELGVLGYPTTDETATPDGVGRFTHFQGGSIYWTPSTGATIVRGAIRDKWEATGWELGVLGYPTTDETGTPDGVGRFNHFQGGSIYWTPSTWSHVVRGDIKATWASLGWELGRLGYPTTDEYRLANGNQRQDFQHGSIVWDHLTRKTTVSYF
ncbi:arylsulfotransferase family protein [Yinghuangia sp. YIM S10712]|uniref:arylsulfotransferase family protein n=1 Tax=Yinghuangia sp. YIM S10712 TaxID=3436930 RepID=UPI003F52DF0D